jgi:dTDP-4-amino-4,6-dideoxygalactose transaminase
MLRILKSFLVERINMNVYKPVYELEKKLSEYTGAPYVVCLDSCTNALFLCCYRLGVKQVTIPKRTYVSVPMSIIHAGGEVEFEDLEWTGTYQLKPYPIWDSAKRLTTDMYVDGTYMTLSFHNRKPLKIGKGGAILCDNEKDYEWFKRARYMGRGEQSYHTDDIDTLGWNMYMTPSQAIRGIELLGILPKHNEDQIEDPPYRDLTTFTVYNN